MKKFDIKSLTAGIIIGTLGITTVFAASGIQSAVLSNTKVTLEGSSLSFNKPLILVTMNNEQDADLYAPINELMEQLGYMASYDSVNNMVNLISGNNRLQEGISDVIPEKDMVINLTNNANQANIAESGSFHAENNQILQLTIISDIKGGSVDLFLFGPNGREERVAVGFGNITKEIALEKGIWKYNCSGIFKDGGTVKITGTIK